MKAIDGLRSVRGGLSPSQPNPIGVPEPDQDSDGPAAPPALEGLVEIASVLEHQAERIADLGAALQHGGVVAEGSDRDEIAARARSQATRVAELENEVARFRAAAEAARVLVLREAARRVEMQTELHAVHLTKLWRYSVLPRRLYGVVLRRIEGRRRSTVRR